MTVEAGKYYPGMPKIGSRIRLMSNHEQGRIGDICVVTAVYSYGNFDYRLPNGTIGTHAYNYHDHTYTRYYNHVPAKVTIII